MDISFPLIAMLLTALGSVAYIIIGAIIVVGTGIFGLYTYKQFRLILNGFDEPVISHRPMLLAMFFGFLLLLWVIFSLSAISAMIAYRPTVAINPNSSYKQNTNKNKALPQENKPHIERDNIKVPNNKEEWEEYKRKFDKNYKESR